MLDIINSRQMLVVSLNLENLFRMINENKGKCQLTVVFELFAVVVPGERRRRAPHHLAGQPYRVRSLYSAVAQPHRELRRVLAAGVR